MGIQACKLAAATYVVPFLFLIYPGMLAAGGALDVADAALPGLLFVLAFALLFGGARITAYRWLPGRGGSGGAGDRRMPWRRLRQRAVARPGMNSDGVPEGP